MTTISSNALILRGLVAASLVAIIFGIQNYEVYQAVWIFGQAHFLMAYYYQYKARKINKSYIVKYLFAFFVVFGVYSLYGPNGWPSFLAQSYFVIHFLYDERFLMSESTSFDGWMRLSPIIIVCSPEFLSRLGIDISEQARVLSLIVLCGYVASRVVKKKSITKQDIYFLLIFCACYFLTYSKFFIAVPLAVSFIILTHYSNWYLNYFVKFSNDPVRLKKFSFEVVAVNILMLLLFYVYVEWDMTSSSVLKYWFRDDYFCLWTIMHYFVTFRQGDLKNWIPDAAFSGRARYGA